VATYCTRNLHKKLIHEKLKIISIAEDIITNRKRWKEHVNKMGEGR
jgi:hypothetical protein